MRLIDLVTNLIDKSVRLYMRNISVTCHLADGLANYDRCHIVANDDSLYTQHNPAAAAVAVVVVLALTKKQRRLTYKTSNSHRKFPEIRS